MAIVDIANRPWVVEIIPDNTVAEFTAEAITVEVPNGTPLVEFRCCEGLVGGGPGTGYDFFADPGLTVAVEALEAVTNVTYGADFATNAETDTGTSEVKVVNPATGAYAYDRLRHVGQHEAGKGTATVALTPVSGVVTVDGALSNVFRLVLTENVQMANPVNPVNGQTINIHLKQDSTGGYDVTAWGTQWTFVNQINPTLTSAANSHDMLSCQWSEADGKMVCSFLPNYGSGYTPPPTAFEDFSFVNVGGGNEVIKDIVGTNINVRTILGTGDIDVSTSGDNIIIDYTAPVGAVEYLNDLIDVDAAAPAVGDTLVWDGTSWVATQGRQWLIGATWSNGANPLAEGVNLVNMPVSESGIIIGWYILSAGGTGSCTIDVRKMSLADFPGGETFTICEGYEPSLEVQSAEDSFDVTGWSDVTVAAGDIIQFSLDYVNVFTTVQIFLVIQKV